MFKRCTYVLALGFLSFGLGAQTNDSDEVDYVLSEEDYVLPFDSLSTKDKMHYSFELGAGFGNSSTYGNYFSTYYKPMISFDVSPRFSVNTGIMYVNSEVSGIPVLSESGYQLFSGNISEYKAFIGGQYELTEKLSVGGSIFYDFTAYDPVSGSSLSGGSGMENLGYSANFDYKVSKSMSIRGEIRVNDRNPYRQSSFSNSFLGAETSLFGR